MVRILTEFNDTLSLDNPTIEGGPGSDTVFGLGGSDILNSSTLGGSLLVGNKENDSLTSTGLGDTVFGGQDNDVVNGLGGQSLFFGDLGDDLIQTFGGGRDTVFGLQGEDIVSFGNNLQGNNIAWGNTEDDFLSGSGLGQDTLYGGQGDDTIQVIELGTGGTAIAGAGGFVPNNTPIPNVALTPTVGTGGTGTTGIGGGAVGVVTGQAAADAPPRNPGNNYLSGDKGNDVIFSLADDDTLLGGTGNDSLVVLSRLTNPPNVNTSLQGSTTNLLTGVPQDDYLDGGDGNDSILSFGGTRGRHTLIGGEGTGQDSLQYVGVEGWVLAGQGDDSLVLSDFNGAFGRSTLYGGGGSDTLRSENGDATGDNLLGSRNWLYGDKGNDSLFGGSADTLFGGNAAGTDAGGNDWLRGGQQSWLSGGQGIDTLIGTGDNATLIGGDGDDSIDVSGNNNASLTGGAGNDIMSATGFNEYLSGGDGNDTLSLQTYGGGAAAGDRANSTLVGGEGNDSLFALSVTSPSWLNGGAGNDILVSGNSSDTLIGGAGNDLYVGSEGADTLGRTPEVGGGARAGNDTLYGFKGADSLIGIVGTFDGFYYTGPGEGGDTITSFDGGTDRFYFSSINFANLASPGSPLRASNPVEFFAVPGGQDYTDANNNGTFVGGTSAPAIIFDSNPTGGTVYFDPSGGNTDATGTSDLSVIAVIGTGQVNRTDIVVF